MTNNPHHESAIQHVTGEAVYVADMLPTGQTLRGRVVYSPHAHARIVSYDLSEALKVEGVHDILCLLYTSDAADDLRCVDLGGRRHIKKKKKTKEHR